MSKSEREQRRGPLLQDLLEYGPPGEADVGDVLAQRNGLKPLRFPPEVEDLGVAGRKEEKKTYEIGSRIYSFRSIREGATTTQAATVETAATIKATPAKDTAATVATAEAET